MHSIHNDPTIASLISALNNRCEELRQFAVRRLVNLGAAAVPGLIQALNSPLEQVRKNAAIALVTLGPIATSELTAAMNEGGEQGRRAEWVLSAMPAEARASGVRRGLWCDSWLTQIRRRLDSNSPSTVRLSHCVALANPA